MSRADQAFLCLSGLLVLGGTSVVAQPQVPPIHSSEAQLFQKVFGTPPPIQPALVPLWIDGTEQGQVRLLIAPAVGEVQIEAVPLQTHLEPTVLPDLLTRLTDQVDAQGNITLTVLKTLGLEAHFDAQRLELRIQTPPQLRRTQRTPVAQVIPEMSNALPPSKLSGYLNIRGGQDFGWGQVREEPTRLNIEGVLNFEGWVLEGNVNIGSAGRGDFRLVHDDPPNALRWSLGDIVIPVSGYQSSRPMAGISVARNFSLQPYRLTRPIGQFTFFLERPSRVEVYINGQQTQVLQLPAGPQDIRSLSLAGGLNAVQLLITDDLGRIERQNFSAATAGQLLAPGVEQFAYAVGLPTQQEQGARIYDGTRPTLSLNHRLGITDTTTLGSYLHVDPRQQLLGFEGAWATSLGNLSTDVAWSHTQGLGSGTAFSLRYNLLQTGQDPLENRDLGISFEHRDAHFASPADVLPAIGRGEHTLVSVSYRQQLYNNTEVSINASQQWGSNPSTQLALGLSRNFDQGLGMNLSFSTINRGGQQEQRIALNLNWRLPQAGQSLQSTLDTTNGNTSQRLTWNYQSPQSVDGWRASVGMNTRADEMGLQARVGYNGYRGEATLTHDQSGSNNLTRLTFGTALVFAAGSWGWSRPVTNSFALIKPHPTLKNQLLAINPGIYGSSAQADQLGPAVLPGLDPYQITQLRVDAPQLALGQDLGQENYALLPQYKSGTLITVGTDATVLITGILQEHGKPLALGSGTIQSLSDPARRAMTIFTNRAGKFALAGLKPGRHILKLAQGATVNFEIPATVQGVYALGTLLVDSVTAPAQVVTQMIPADPISESHFPKHQPHPTVHNNQKRPSGYYRVYVTQLKQEILDELGLEAIPKQYKGEAVWQIAAFKQVNQAKYLVARLLGNGMRIILDPP